MGKRILVVDDDMVCMKTVQRYLSEEKYDVLGAMSGIQAVHIVEETNIDLLLLDIEMPGLNGFATLEQIRELPNGKQLPVIFFTGRTDRDTLKRSVAMGTDSYITKPIEKHILLERVKEICTKNSDGEDEKTVLVVDQDIEFLKQTKQNLKDYYKMILVSSAKSAIEYLTNHTVNLIVWNTSVPLLEESGAERLLMNSKEKISVLVLDGTESEKESSLPSHWECLKTPIGQQELLKSIRSQFEQIKKEET